MYTKKGQHYRLRSRGELCNDSNGTYSLDAIENRHGVGTRLYFCFLISVIISNVIIMIISVSSWISSVSKAPFEWSSFFISGYTNSAATVWFGTMSSILGVWFLFGPCYYCWERFLFHKKNDSTHQDLIEQNGQQTRGVVVGFMIMCVFIGIGGGLLYGLVSAQAYVGGTNTVNGILMSICVSIGYVVVVQSWGFLSYLVTDFERNQTWFAFRMSQAFKLITFKILMTTLLYLILALVLPVDNSSCAFYAAGIQFLITIFLDLIASIAVQIVVPLTYHRVKPDAQKSEFNMAEELLIICHRQFILYIGVLVFPLLSILVVIGNIIQYPIDVIRLRYICEDSHIIEEQPGLFLFMFITLASVAALLTYPNGALWVLFLPHNLPIGFHNCSIYTFAN